MMKRFAVVLGVVWMLVPVATWATSKAGVVIQNSTGEGITRCVEFEEPSVTVLELLQRSGFKLVTSQDSDGTRICFLHNDGASGCAAVPGGLFWRAYQKDGADWVSLQQDVSVAIVTDGMLVGFVCGPGGLPPEYEAKPPARTFADVCEVTSRAGLVIDHSDGSRVVKVVEFPGETMTGLQLLKRSGLDLVSNDFGWGIAICAIDGEGRPSEDCFGELGDPIWNFNILQPDGSWMASWVGAADTVLYDGDVHGYIYGVWGIAQPPIMRTDVFGQTSNVPFWEAYAR